MQPQSAMFITPLVLGRQAITKRWHSVSGSICSSKPLITMRGSPLSRRDVGKLACGAVGALIASVLGSTLTPSAAAVASSNDTGSKAGKKGNKAPAFIKDESGVQYFDTKTGSGASPMEGDFVVVDYLAFLSNGKLFDNRKGFVFQMGQRQVIPGLEIAISSMQPGGERKAVVPAALAYGDKGVCVPGQDGKDECLVPPGERLGFDVKLVRVAVSPT